MRHPFWLTASIVLLAGCGAEPPGLPAPGERLGLMRGEIVGGELDTKHQSVVAIFGTQSACTATIIAVKGNQGYALTAAHCVKDAPQYVVQGNDYNSASTIVYEVVQYKAHPSYNGQVYDFAMVRFTGAGAKTPVTPAMTPAQDGLKPGSTLEFVGYGLTENGPTTKRHHVFGNIDDLSSLTFDYQQQSGGPCAGDSGGPSLTVVNGVEYVSGVTSYGDQNCTQYGVSGRVSAVYDSFILPFINGGGGGGQQTCDQCTEAATTGVGDCADAVQGCLNHAGCNALVECFEKCSTDACIQQCAQDNPTGVDKYLAIFDCVCTEACVAECGKDEMCQTPEGPACGFSADAECQLCFEAKCCAQASACADDPVCATCFGNDPDPACDQSSKAQAFAQCLVDQCADPCGIETGSSSGSSGSGSSGETGSTGSGSSGETTDAGVGGGDAAGAAGAGGGDEASSSGDEGGKKKKKKSNDATDDVEEESGCAVKSPGGSSSSPIALHALATLVAAIALRFRRRA